MRGFVVDYIDEAHRILGQLDPGAIDNMARVLAELRRSHGRLFLIGVGGSAANCSHAVNDFRKICGIEAYAPTDNVAELTARTNDDGWSTVFSEWLKVSRLSSKDMLLVFSVGGGGVDVSQNIVRAVELARERNVLILGVVSRDGGYTAKNATICIKIPIVNPEHITPHAEAFQAFVWHCLVSHPALRKGAPI